jgi:hypothetical protein
MDMSITTSQVQEISSDAGAAYLNLAALKATALERDPFDYIVVPSFISLEALAEINRGYPDITEPGNFKLDDLRYGSAFSALLDELAGPALKELVAAKFGVDLSECPQQVTVRKYSEPTDGHIHVDHRTKVITMLVYLNENWNSEEGQLRFLRSADDIEDFAAEVPPIGGTMLAFRRSDKSFHGFKPFVGERRMIQLAWVREGTVSRYEKRLNRLSKPLRRFLNMS